MRPNFPAPVVLTLSNAIRHFAPSTALPRASSGINSRCSNRSRVFLCSYGPRVHQRVFLTALFMSNADFCVLPHIKPVAPAFASPPLLWLRSMITVEKWGCAYVDGLKARRATWELVRDEDRRSVHPQKCLVFKTRFTRILKALFFLVYD